MTLDRPMNEYEGALFSALMVLTTSIARGETDRPTLAANFREAAKDSAGDDRKNASAVLEILGNLAEADRFFRPKSPFSVIDGGKVD